LSKLRIESGWLSIEKKFFILNLAYRQAGSPSSSLFMNRTKYGVSGKKCDEYLRR